jgi:hypothetical protein
MEKICGVYNVEYDVSELDSWDEWSSIEVPPTPVDTSTADFAVLFPGGADEEEEDEEQEAAADIESDEDDMDAQENDTNGDDSDVQPME